MKNVFIGILLCCFSTALFSQDVLFSQKVKDSYEDKIFGKNQKHYVHSFFSLSFVPFVEENNIKIKFPFSCDAEFGIRYKRKINRMLDFGFDFGCSMLQYRIAQDAGKNVTDTHLYDKERLIVSSLPFRVFLRINMEKRRGDYIGKFMDLGGGVNWNFNFTQYTLIKSDDKRTRSKITGWDQFNPLTYNAFIRFGKNYFAVRADYRLASLMKDSAAPDLPPLLIGIDLGSF